MARVRIKAKLRRTGVPGKIVAAVIGEEIAHLTWAQAETLGPTLVHAVRRGIQDQKFKHRPLSPAYKRWKIKSGLDPRILIATGEYLGSIQVLGTKRFTRSARTRVGVKAGTHKPSGLTYNQLARVHEYGFSTTYVDDGGNTRNVWVPARPHWGPVVRDFKKITEESRRKAAGDLVSRVRAKLRRYRNR